MVAVGKKRNGMIDKTIICLSARANSGKTTSIRELFFALQDITLKVQEISCPLYKIKMSSMV